MKTYTLAEVAEHHTPGDIWLAIDGKVYDVSAFSTKHPGGVVILASVGGTDCTEAFHGYHPPHVAPAYLPSMQIGVVANYAPTKMRREYKEMEQRMIDAGLYKTPVLRYVWYFTYCAALLAAAFALVLRFPEPNNMWAHALGAVCLGMFWQQLSFCGHDFGHNSVTPKSSIDYYAGSMLVNSLYGVSGQWWKATHNVHHVVTNSVEYDPDVQYLPVFAVNSKLLGAFFSHYHQKVFTFGNWQRLLLSVQHLLYFPVMALARFNLYIQSLIFLTTAPSTECPKRGSALLSTGFFFVWCGWLVAQLPDAKSRWMFVLLSHAIAGIIHVQITLSHFGMDTYYGKGIQLTDPDHFVKLQLQGSLNIDCPEMMDWFHGGLQFQIEHHLFPRLPRYNLRRARDEFVKPFMKRHGVRHEEDPFFTAIERVLRSLREAAKKAWSLSDKEVAARSKLGMLANAEG